MVVSDIDYYLDKIVPKILDEAEMSVLPWEPERQGSIPLHQVGLTGQITRSRPNRPASDLDDSKEKKLKGGIRISSVQKLLEEKSNENNNMEYNFLKFTKPQH